jgi:hypothetical protein
MLFSQFIVDAIFQSHRARAYGAADSSAFSTGRASIYSVKLARQYLQGSTKGRDWKNRLRIAFFCPVGDGWANVMVWSNFHPLGPQYFVSMIPIILLE